MRSLLARLFAPVPTGSAPVPGLIPPVLIRRFRRALDRMDTWAYSQLYPSQPEPMPTVSPVLQQKLDHDELLARMSAQFERNATRLQELLAHDERVLDERHGVGN